ncbi:MAG: hypothetical protein KGL39_15870 [Patescibacteria group bacterium]|nr:hypothetical protein [Patescibacteria group bacterium]
MIYRYRYRSSTTGAKSLQSPPMRADINARRQGITLTPGAYSSDPQVDTIDWERFSPVTPAWLYIGSQPNSGTFLDQYADSEVAANGALETNVFQPFPTIDLPRASTVNVIGTTVEWVSGDAFNLRWSAGTQILIAGVPFTLYQSPTSSTFLQIVESGGYQTSVSMTIPEATLLAQPLPALWGPYTAGGSTGAFFFACGDPLQPGSLFFTNGNDPDSASDTNTIDVTSPSEPLLNGALLGDQPIVFSTRRMFLIQPLFSQAAISEAQAFGVASPPPSGNLFAAQEVTATVGKGLAAQWALTPFPGGIAWLSSDGIYVSGGGDCVSITDDDLYPLFPHDGQPAQTVNGIVPPDLTQTASLRLAYSSGRIFFDFITTSAVRARLVYNLALKGWESRDSTTPATATVYNEEGASGGVESLLLGGTNGVLYIAGGPSDAGAVISGLILGPSLDHGDRRSLKLWGDYILDCDTQGAQVTPTALINNGQTSLVAPAFSLTPRGQQIISLNASAGQYARNIGIQLAWASSTATPTFWEWQPSIIPGATSISRLNWASPFTSHGLSGFLHIRDGYATLSSTSPVTLTLTYDSGVTNSITLPSTGGIPTRLYWIPLAGKGKLVAYTLASSAPFSVFGKDSVVNMKGWGMTGPYQAVRPFADFPGDSTGE